jgi:transposase
MNASTTYSVGIDLHKTVLQICVLDVNGEILEERRFRGGSIEEGFEAVHWLTQWREGGRYCVEAVGMNRWLVNACLELGLDIVVVDSTKMGLRMLGKKTDRRDAYELARRLRLGDVDRNAATYFANEEEYASRKLVRTRHGLTQSRQELLNQIRAMLATYRVDGPKNQLYRVDRGSNLPLRGASAPSPACFSGFPGSGPLSIMSP